MHTTYIKKGINVNLEALRGYAALFVVLNHIEALRTVFDARYLPKLTVLLAPNGHMFVLVFFVLSGYVIAISNQHFAGKGAVSLYLKKRLLRIYPIYFLAMLVTLLVAREHYSFYQIAGNFLLLQMLLVQVFNENGAAWSLNFEVVYYLLYVPINYFKSNALWITGIALSMALLNVPLIAPYCLGFVFWMSGLCIARYFKGQKEAIELSRLVSGLLLLLAVDQLLARTGLPGLLNGISILPVTWSSGFITTPLTAALGDLVYLPYFIFFVMLFSGTKYKNERLYFLALQAPLILSIALTAGNYLLSHNGPGLAAYGISVGYYLISMMMWFKPIRWLKGMNQKIMDVGAWLGSISYGLYIIHAPLLHLAGRLSFADNAALNYIIKLILFMATAIIAAFILEKKVQPALKRIILPGGKKAIS